MPRRAVLSAAQRSFFEALPTESVELAKHYLLSDEDLALVRERRRQENRLGFAVQLCLSRFPGRLLRVGENPPLPRTRVQAGLNKGEARNSLARTVFFNRLGEVRDRAVESQSVRASGLNLLVAAIILWNTRYLETAVEQVRAKTDVPDEYLQYLSPLGCEHIILTGDYIWKLP